MSYNPKRRRCGGRRRAQEGMAAVPLGGGGAWPDNEPTHRVTHQRPGAAGVEGAGGPGGPGCGARGRRRGLAGLRDDAPSAARGADGSRAGRRPRAHQAARPNKALAAPGTPAAPKQHSNKHRNNAQAYKKTDIRIGCRPVVELGGFEPPTFSLRTRRATNCAIAPRTRTA